MVTVATKKLRGRRVPAASPSSLLPSLAPARQDPRVVVSALMKLAGGSPSFAAELNVDA